MKTQPILTLAVPSKGNLYDPTLSLFKECGLAIRRPDDRVYEGTVSSEPGLRVVFQRVSDIASKVEEGLVDIGVCGLDLVREEMGESTDVSVVIEDLGYGRCDLVVAVPEAWADVTAVGDLAELSVLYREQRRELRVGTKFPRLTSEYLHRYGVHYFTLVESHGALELAPTLGFADFITDLTATGTTLRTNRLKMIRNGTIFRAQTCLIANLRTLADPERLAMTRRVVESLEARLRGKQFVSVTANVRGKTADTVAQHVCSRPELAGRTGPTIAPVFSKNGRDDLWLAVTVLVEQKQLRAAVEHLRQIGGSGVSVAPLGFMFDADCEAYGRLEALVQRRRGA